MLNSFSCICDQANLILVKYIDETRTTHQNCIQHSCKFLFFTTEKVKNNSFIFVVRVIYFLFSFFNLVCFDFCWFFSILYFSLIWKNRHKLLFFFMPFHNSTILKTLWTFLQKVVEKSSKNICWLYLKTQSNFPLPKLPIILALSMTISKCHCLRQRGWESIPHIMTKHRVFHQLSQFMLPLSIWIKFLRTILELVGRHQLCSPTILKTSTMADMYLLVQFVTPYVP